MHLSTFYYEKNTQMIIFKPNETPGMMILALIINIYIFGSASLSTYQIVYWEKGKTCFHSID